MKLERIHEHTVDTSLLPDGANILDIGCRGFLFTNYFNAIGGYNVYPVDIDYLGPEGYFQVAICDYNGFCTTIKTSDSQATRISKGRVGNIHCRTLESFMKDVKIKFFDLIKIDVEGSEYEIIMSLDKAPAKQLSIEFHLHTGIYGYYEMTMMEDKLKALGYYAVQHELTEEHGAGKNYWDSLWILK